MGALVMRAAAGRGRRKAGGAAPSVGPITLAVELSGVSGVAPYGVTVSATSTAKTGESDPQRNLTYLYDFGESGKPAPTYGADDQADPAKQHGGPVGAYPYETAGSFTLKVWATDGVNKAGPFTQTITVTDPNVFWSSSNPDYDIALRPYETIVCSTSGNFTGKPAGATEQTVANFAAAMAFVGTKKRVLLCRTDTWAPAAQVNMVAVTDACIGSYGTGTQALLACSVAVNGLFNPQGLLCARIQVRDVRVTGPSSTRAVNVAASVQGDIITLYNVHADGIAGLLNWAAGTDPTLATVTRVNVIKCKATQIQVSGNTGSNGAYLAAWQWGMVWDSLFEDSRGGEHCFRMAFGKDFLFYGSTFKDSASLKGCLVVRSAGYAAGIGGRPGGAGTQSSNVWARNCVVAQGASTAGGPNPGFARTGIGLGVVNPAAGNPDRTTNCGFEQCLIMASGVEATQLSDLCAINSTYRNCITYYSTGAQSYLTALSTSPHADWDNTGHIACGNTMVVTYDPFDAGGYGANVVAAGGSDNVVATCFAGNNALYAPLVPVGNRSLIDVNWTNSGGSHDAGTTDPLFAGPLTGLTTRLRAFKPAAGSVFAGKAVANQAQVADAIGMLRSAGSAAGALNTSADATSIWSLVS